MVSRYLLRLITFHTSNTYTAVWIDISNKASHILEVTEQIRENTIGIFNSPVSYRASWLTPTDDKILELLTMLTPLEPLKRHQDVRLPRSKNAGAWLLNLESFSTWRDSTTIEENSRVFCCYGIPGAGKTVIRYLLKPPVYLTKKAYEVTDTHYIVLL